MRKQTSLQSFFYFFLTKIVVGVVVIGGSVALIEWGGRFLFENASLPDDAKNVIIAFADAAVALASYFFLFRAYEKRQIKELSFENFGSNAMIGFATGTILQSVFILVIYFAGDYSIITVNPFSFLLPAFSTAFTTGFVAEILIRGIFFRLVEEKLGAAVALLIITLLFGLLHVNVAGATTISVLATAVQAGLLLSAVYVFTRSLWTGIFLHFTWDFAEPGVFWWHQSWQQDRTEFIYQQNYGS